MGSDYRRKMPSRVANKKIPSAVPRRLMGTPAVLLEAIENNQLRLSSSFALAFGFRKIFEINIYRPRPVLRSNGSFKFQFLPPIQLNLFYRGIEILYFDCAIFFIDRDNLKKAAVFATIPDAYFRICYPMISITGSCPCEPDNSSA